MIANLKLNEDQILALLADRIGCKPDAIEFTYSAGTGNLIATVETDFKGAKTIERIAKKHGVSP